MTNKIPSIILSSPKYIIKAFLQGLFDGDGSCTKGIVSYTTVSKVLKEQFENEVKTRKDLENKLAEEKQYRESLEEAVAELSVQLSSVE